MYISNAKLTNLEEISVSSFLFFTLLVGFSSLGPLSGGFAPPAAQANLRSVFHDFKACATLRILHFYLELRIFHLATVRLLKASVFPRPLHASATLHLLIALALKASK